MAKRFGRNNFLEMIETNLIKLASLAATHLGPQPFAQDSEKPNKNEIKDSDFIDIQIPNV